MDDNVKKDLEPTVAEIYERQERKCWIEAEFDTIDGKEVLGDFFCTDGEFRCPTLSLLNPSTECIKCILNYIFDLELVRG
jgi:hypothetical protein